ncbi:MAG: citramalate synthase [Pseudomonadota bacterium]
MTQQIYIYDTTLRDGTQSEDVQLTMQDKLKIALRLDELGVHYIEAGWPGSNPVDVEFFHELQRHTLKTAKISAFGSTHHPATTADKDANLNAIIAARTHAAVLFGKSCEHHAKEALRIEPELNLTIIENSLAYVGQHVAEIFFDAEHFFDAYKRNATYALEVLKRAHGAGAQCLALCDTNGGTMPHEVHAIVTAVRQALPDAMIGIHAHNDCEMAVANSIAAVQAGARQIQGTINGIGERCGNANLSSIIPVLELKSGGAYTTLPEGHLQQVTAVSSYVAEVANQPLFSRQPFVGRSAFAHKGGVHVSAINRNSSLYEHIEPETVGNSQRVLITELAGRSNIVSLAKRFGFHLDKDEPVVKGLMHELKKKTSLGYDYAAAEASVELLLLRKLARRGVREFFTLKQFRVQESRLGSELEPTSEATVMVDVEGVIEHTAATGLGPVNALDNALRKALVGFYPRIGEMRLVDFKVRVLTGKAEDGGTASTVRVLVESSDAQSRWVTVGVSYNIIEASWQAVADSITYKLYKDEQEHRGTQGTID